MDYLQYTSYNEVEALDDIVLNLIINGLPSICKDVRAAKLSSFKSFKPYYKWITFNILSLEL